MQKHSVTHTVLLVSKKRCWHKQNQHTKYREEEYTGMKTGHWLCLTEQRESVCECVCVRMWTCCECNWDSKVTSLVEIFHFKLKTPLWEHTNTHTLTHTHTKKSRCFRSTLSQQTSTNRTKKRGGKEDEFRGNGSREAERKKTGMSGKGRMWRKEYDKELHRPPMRHSSLSRCAMWRV